MKEEQFLREYWELCKKHGLALTPFRQEKECAKMYVDDISDRTGVYWDKVYVEYRFDGGRRILID